MRHHLGHRRLSRNHEHRRALLRNLATSLIKHERIRTTLPKAKELRSVVEKLVTLGKRGDLHARRLIGSYLFEKGVTNKLVDDLAKRFAQRPGGYTRILRQGVRLGDGSRMATIEFVDYSFEKQEAEKSTKD